MIDFSKLHKVHILELDLESHHYWSYIVISKSLKHLENF